MKATSADVDKSPRQDTSEHKTSACENEDQRLKEFERAGMQKYMYLYTKRCEEEKTETDKKVDTKHHE